MKSRTSRRTEVRIKSEVRKRTRQLRKERDQLRATLSNLRDAGAEVAEARRSILKLYDVVDEAAEDGDEKLPASGVRDLLERVDFVAEYADNKDWREALDGEQ